MIQLNPIGVIHSPFKESNGTPIQTVSSEAIGEIEIYNAYQAGLTDLEGFSHVILIYHFHKINSEPLRVVPFLDTVAHGVFATRSPARPNRLGISIVEIRLIEQNRIHILNIDVLDGTPLLDIKPYIPEFDARETNKIGWLEKNINKTVTDDGRFLKSR